MKSPNINILRWKIFENLPVDTGITTRTGGVSKEPYSSLNLATHTGDNPESVRENRGILCRELNISPDLYTHGIQVHSDTIHIVNEKNIGVNTFECDALFTAENSVMLNIYVADCVPVVLYDRSKSLGMLCHCGWKGTYKKLLKKAINFMLENYNSRIEDILAGIGPSIGGCCYNVSEELYNKFSPSKKEGHIVSNNYFLDLKEINFKIALESGIEKSNIEIMNLCTKCNNNLFYSYRKEGESSGRFSCFLKING